MGKAYNTLRSARVAKKALAKKGIKTFISAGRYKWFVKKQKFHYPR